MSKGVHIDWTEFRDKQVRDLAWMLGSTAIAGGSNIRDWGTEQLERYQTRLKVLDNDPELLHRFLDKRHSTLLGKYFENLFCFWAEDSPGFEIVLENQQVSIAGSTYTEIDIVLKDLDSDTYHHHELALKYYLGKKDTTRTENWIGPNANDTLYKKLETVEEKQLKVFETEEGQSILHENGIERVTSYLFMKGYLFHPKGVSSTVPVGCETAHTDHGWVRKGDVDQVLDRNLFWCILPKSYWLSPNVITPGELEILRSSEVKREVDKRFRQIGKAQMLSTLRKEHGLFIENNRWMVVGDDWPAV